MQIRKGLALCTIVLAFVVGMFIPVTATTINSNDESATVPIELNVTTAAFNVVMPTSLPITVSSTGVVTTATDAKIINNSHGAVKVTDIDIEAAGGWAIVGYDEANMIAEKVGAKKIALEVNGDKTTENGGISFDSDNWPGMDGANSGDTDELSISYDAKLPAQIADLSGEIIANIIFVVGWDTIE